MLGKEGMENNTTILSFGLLLREVQKGEEDIKLSQHQILSSISFGGLIESKITPNFEMKMPKRCQEFKSRGFSYIIKYIHDMIL